MPVRMGDHTTARTVHFSSSFSSYHPGGSYREEGWGRWHGKSGTGDSRKTGGRDCAQKLSLQRWACNLCRNATGRLSCQVGSGMWEIAPVGSATVLYTLFPETCLQHWRECVSEADMSRKDPKKLYHAIKFCCKTHCFLHMLPDIPMRCSLLPPTLCQAAVGPVTTGLWATAPSARVCTGSIYGSHLPTYLDVLGLNFYYIFLFSWRSVINTALTQW